MAYRPGWFPEYNPTEQKIFDSMTDILRQHFEQRNYVHIHTPAVESTDILSRGGDVFDKQVYGLYWLAQWVEDVKDYGLHFDLTIPFARYVLDHLNELTFPFKRYQMQPVWRWERTKRWRYKEFWQFDIDTIWRSDQDVGMWYDAECIIVMVKALQEIFASNWIETKLSVKVSNIKLINSISSARWLNSDQNKTLFKTLDDWYKRTSQANQTLLETILTPEQQTIITNIIESQSLDWLEQYEWYHDLKWVLEDISSFGIDVEFSLPIVRGHGYYTGTVVEIFLWDDMSLWAIAWWWRYERLTDFISPKQSFSGVGCSISNRIMELLLTMSSDNTSTVSNESYLVINFEDTRKQSLELLAQYITNWKTCEIYPTPAKLGKQFEYADKKWITHCIIMGSGELGQWIYKIKNLSTGEEDVININQ